MAESLDNFGRAIRAATFARQPRLTGASAGFDVLMMSFPRQCSFARSAIQKCAPTRLAILRDRLLLANPVVVPTNSTPRLTSFKFGARLSMLTLSMSAFRGKADIPDPLANVR
jgi:hypothetical protein